MSEMIEALVDQVRTCVYESENVADHMHQQAAENAVRAVLGSLRVPTEAMVERGGAAVEIDMIPLGHSAAKVWEAMIDEALMA